MCIIAVKKEGVDLPSDRIIKKMFETNSDGAGFMVKRKSKKSIELRKGFDTIEKFLEALKNADIEKDDIVVMHFRIATIGGKEPRLTHPFIASTEKERAETLWDLNIKDEMCFAHNGTLSNFSTEAAKQLRSDSSLFASTMMSEKFLRDSLFNPAMHSLIDNYIGSNNKLAVVDPRYHCVSLFGEWSGKNYKEYKWNEAEGGMIYSNYTWEIASTPLYRGYGETYLRSVRGNIQTNETSATNSTGKEVKHRAGFKSSQTHSTIGKSTNELFDEYDDLDSGFSDRSIIKSYIDLMSPEEFDSFLDHNMMRKLEFWHAVGNKVISIKDFEHMYDDWLNKYYSDNEINYRSGVIVTKEGVKNLDQKKKK